MESAPVSIAFVARVVAIEEKFTKKWLGGVGADARFEDISLGWFVGLNGSYEFLHVGSTKPEIKIGDHATIRISFNAKPSEPPIQ